MFNIFPYLIESSLCVQEAGILRMIPWKEPDGRLTDRVIPLGVTGKQFARWVHRLVLHLIHCM
jgi:hypothetical protein